MLAKRFRFSLGLKHLPLITIVPSALLTYGVVIFLISLADAIMSYSTPIFLQNNLNNSFQMGMLLGISSLAGIIFDIFLGKVFCHKSYTFFIWATFLVAFSFPIIFLILPGVLAFFILAMIVWGVYYELIQFANFRFIHAFVEKKEYAPSWGILSIFKSTAYLAGPLLGSLMINAGTKLPFFDTLGLLSAAFFAFLVFLKRYKQKRLPSQNQNTHHTGFVHQVYIIKALMGKIWPLWLFNFSVLFVDATFWSVGTLLSEDLKNRHPLGGFLLFFYMLPSLFVGLFAKYAAIPFGKKRVAFLSGIGSGIILSTVGLVNHPVVLLILVFLSSVFGALAVPEILAVFEDYVVRVGTVGDEVIALERSSENVAYILGPIIAGGIALLVGYRQTFLLAGLCLAIVSLIALVVVPRKIRLPQKEIAQEA